jgi:hypothetical protein
MGWYVTTPQASAMMPLHTIRTLRIRQLLVCYLYSDTTVACKYLYTFPPIFIKKILVEIHYLALAREILAVQMRIIKIVTPIVVILLYGASF